MATNVAKNMEKENIKLKDSLAQLVHKNEKNERRDNKIFEKIFGKQPRAMDLKIRDFITGYENQRERLDDRISSLEDQIQKVNVANAKLINENKCLTKGTPQGHSEYYYMKDEGKLVKRLDELEAVKDNLMKALARKEETIETNLNELDTIKEVKQEMMLKIKNLEHDLSQGPSIQDLHTLHNKITKLEKENSKLNKANNNLENEIMMVKNNSNGHIKSLGTNKTDTSRLSMLKGPPGDSALEYDNSSASILLSKVCDILNIKSTVGNAQILETVQKIQRVVMAVPRMEAFIKQISNAVFQGQNNPSLEHIVPEVHRIHQ